MMTDTLLDNFGGNHDNEDLSRCEDPAAPDARLSPDQGIGHFAKDRGRVRVVFGTQVNLQDGREIDLVFGQVFVP